MAVRVDEDVLELDVPVDDAARMKVPERGRQFVEPGPQTRPVGYARAADVLQRFGFAGGVQHEVHHDVRVPVRLRPGAAVADAAEPA